MRETHSQIALVPVAEWRRLVLAKRSSPNHTRDVVLAMLGGWRKRWGTETPAAQITVALGTNISPMKAPSLRYTSTL